MQDPSLQHHQAQNPLGAYTSYDTSYHHDAGYHADTASAGYGAGALPATTHGYNSLAGPLDPPSASLMASLNTPLTAALAQAGGTPYNDFTSF